MPHVDYGYGLVVDWTPVELAKIERYRSEAAARRILRHPTTARGRFMTYRDHPEREEAMRKLARDIYLDLKKNRRDGVVPGEGEMV